MSAVFSCRSGVELLMEYLEGELSPEQRAEIDAHVAGCPLCVAFVESYRQTPPTLRRATLATLPAGLGTSLRTFLRTSRGRP